MDYTDTEINDYIRYLAPRSSVRVTWVDDGIQQGFLYKGYDKDYRYWKRRLFQLFGIKLLRWSTYQLNIIKLYYPCRH